RTLDARLQEELLAIGRGPDFFPLQPALNSFASAKPGSVAPTAREAAVLATSKAIVELPTLGHLDGLRGLLDEPPGEEIWKALAASPGHEVVLSHESEALLRKILQPSSEAEAQDVLRTFRSSVALDTARNQYLLRRSIHSLLAAREPGLTPEAVDEQVYGEVFRTPLSDPWFGLAPSEVFSAFRKVQGLPVAQAGQGIP
ncbi:MAG: hypothetical protein KDD47_20725, partial [Acidobacteria bacterium]|nr:hypothetical protein [Acidobacteriota bacterium]